MIKDLLRIRYLYNVFCEVVSHGDPIEWNIWGLKKRKEQLRGEWSVKFSSFLRQVGRKK